MTRGNRLTNTFEKGPESGQGKKEGIKKRKKGKKRGLRRGPLSHTVTCPKEIENNAGGARLNLCNENATNSITIKTEYLWRGEFSWFRVGHEVRKS